MRETAGTREDSGLKYHCTVVVLGLLSWTSGVLRGITAVLCGTAGGEVSPLSEAGLSRCKCRILCNFRLLFCYIE